MISFASKSFFFTSVFLALLKRGVPRSFVNPSKLEGASFYNKDYRKLALMVFAH